MKELVHFYSNFRVILFCFEESQAGAKPSLLLKTKQTQNPNLNISYLKDNAFEVKLLMAVVRSWM